MKTVINALAPLACLGLAWIVAALWISLRPTTLGDFEPLGIEQIDSDRQLYIWLAVFSLLCLFWFLWTKKIKT